LGEDLGRKKNRRRRPVLLLLLWLAGVAAGIDQ
jgi:hypothetical protein